MASTKNAQQVLDNVENLIKTLNDNPDYGLVAINEVCEDLNIFDWWKEGLSKTNLLDMRKFLKEAIKLGYTGYVCFKVGATGCANGMWAYKSESTDGCSPDGEALYKSFTPAYNYWAFCTDGTNWESEFGTIKELEQAINNYKASPLEDRIKELEKELEQARLDNEYLQDRICEVENSLEYFEGEGYWEQFDFESKIVKALQDILNRVKEYNEAGLYGLLEDEYRIFRSAVGFANVVLGKEIIYKEYTVSIQDEKGETK